VPRRPAACGGDLESGFVQARNTNVLAPEAALVKQEPFMVVAAFAFVRPGVPTSMNPVSAFLQGMREEPADQLLPITAFRCTGCGRVELYAGPE
jgi:hypothetical protein